jgi:GNAT superfamily N-acetyltransferase
VLMIRSATELDCSEISRIHAIAVRALPSGTKGKHGIEQWLSSRKPSVYVHEMKTELFVVAEEETAILGWGALNLEKQQITNVFVDPEHHRRRIGTAIVKQLEEAATAAGIANIHLQATGTAIDFYRTIGFHADPPVADGADWAMFKKVL